MEYGRRPNIEEAIRLRNSYYKGLSIGRKLGGTDDVQDILKMSRLFPRRLSQEEIMYWQKGFHDGVMERRR